MTDFLAESDPLAALDTIDLISEAVGVLRRHPNIGRVAEGGLRELLISRGRSGYAALYRIDDDSDTVLILSIRHQREAGFGPPA
ncbi:MAG: type II toxin-antitoxin system RelE/ParE family toxin [Pseudomonadota bacterium]